MAGVIEQLEGFEVPAAAWEGDVLPARLQDYDGAWLDSLCLSGRALWARLDRPASATAGPVRATPIALLTRKNRPLWQSLRATGSAGGRSCRPTRGAMAEFLQQHGASFFDEIIQRHRSAARAGRERRWPSWWRRAGVSADSFGGLRALLMPLERKRKLAARGRRRRTVRAGGGRSLESVHRLARGADACRCEPAARARRPWPGCCCAAMAWYSGAC